MDKILKAADDIAAVFNVTQEWLEPGRSAVVKILKQLVEEKFTSTNKQSTPCQVIGCSNVASVHYCESCISNMAIE